MKEGWTRTLVGQWEVPAPGFDSQEVIPDEVNNLYPLEIQEIILEVREETFKIEDEAKMISLPILGPVEKDGRKVFVARKVIYTKP